MNGPRWRVGFLTDGWWPEPGGVQTLTRELAAEFTRRGHEVFVLALQHGDQSSPGTSFEDRIDGVLIRRVTWSHEADQTLDGLSRSIPLEEQVARWNGEFGLDLVHVHSLSTWGLGVPARLRELGVPVMWTWHDYWPLCPRGQMWHVDGFACERAEPTTCGSCVARTWPQLSGNAQPVMESRLGAAHAAVEACARVFCPSAAARAIVLRHGFAEQSIGLCQNGSRADVVPLEGAVRGDQSVVCVGVLGTVQPSKGVLELANWIVELGEPFQLEVFGTRPAYHGDSSYVQALEALAGRSPRVILRDAYEPLERAAVFGSLDLVALPSLWEEVHGLVARETRLAGLPVFVSDRGGLPDPAFHVLPAGDGAAWKRALERFAADPAWRRELCQEASELRTTAQMAEDLLDEYAAAIGS